ncbi:MULTISPECIES: ABC transporter substrate-binding protein [unclassified Corynebacterium]|uniref:heme/hemin ABC transporter substrate-binding protein n=1 Tax=unclassified Corynebacterium TaxID=2624378 RepID=UPI001C469F4B|nr:ABC transporter substrate-binding protein [Corynebacterium sp. TAE3-ERU30]MBV7301598.1 ABC transporter substrate-binding protein [Corynebacterium sp. TAE3-ERU2]
MKIRLAALSLIGSVVLAGCGLNVSTPGDNNNNARAEQTSFEQALENLNSSSAEVGDSGAVETQLVGDVTPVAEDVSPELPVELSDSDGYDVTVTDVSRIMPLDLYGTTSRTIAGLGLRDNIVGRTVSSEEPSLQELPVVTQGGHNINVEAVLALDPSLIIVDHSIGPDSAIDQLRDAGVTTVVINPSRKMASIGDDIRTIAGVVGLDDEGEELAERAEKERDEAIDAVSEIVPDQAPRAAFVYARGSSGVFFILGPESGTAELFESVGAVDAAKEADIADMAPANAEAFAKLNPDVIVMMSKGLESTGGVDGMLSRPGVAETEAAKNKRFITIADSQALSFGPQTGEMILAFATALYNPNSQ